MEPKQPSAAAVESPMRSARRNRLLRDIAEMQQRPYPRIQLTPVDLERACLVLTTEAYPPLHLTIFFGPEYPLQPPHITIQSKIRHPNIYGNYICASILNTAEGYTPAYTLKGICIQMLSFFNSDSVEQTYSGHRISLSEYKEYGRQREGGCAALKCSSCGFGSLDKDKDLSALCSRSHNKGREESNSLAAISRKASENGTQKRAVLEASIDSLPDEILLEMLENVDFEDLVAFSQAWPRVRRILRDYDLIRSRELHCFTLKESYKQAKLGIGIAFTPAGLVPRIDSEFDLISYEAYQNLRVRKSVHGIPYQFWLPLPLSHRHWSQVRGDAGVTLRLIAQRITKSGDGGRRSSPRVSTAGALFSFMNDIVVRLNLDLERQQGSSGRRRRRPRYPGEEYEPEEDDSLDRRSTLRHASEKAIESYFHLFHLLLCLATGPNGKDIVAEANKMIRSFLGGRRGKQDVPNLGHLLTAMHISDVEVTDELRKAIITEAITRNVVWLLDGRGAGMAELGYLEADAVSHHRLKRTFEGSRTSYRLLMFSELFRRVARPHMGAAGGAAKPSLAQIRDGLFARHGAPPAGAAAYLAAEVRRLQQIDAFPPFLAEMGVKAMPSARNFTTLLRDTVKASAERGYSRTVPAHSLLSLRMHRDEDMDREAAIEKIWGGGSKWQYSVQLAEQTAKDVRNRKLTFFPERKPR
ncbi:Ubiquitin-conjugating enzyme/RWD-like protein [Akanthomyces lecanii RCEF 1005]|uniref:Ubiquitin-conjugating enzyme/RWD-like protein n=1 Tax=Akanthomyces lecanii RCEF 1005 TaxID=1081108 RepID=A0A168HT76_CORDF|nr:Ubiquitin-conjugating enzyme/RWD-like protein [Akanthomyces lecanii RCEF 1005]